jgi:hypothetical protein
MDTAGILVLREEVMMVSGSGEATVWLQKFKQCCNFSNTKQQSQQTQQTNQIKKNKIKAKRKEKK